MSVSFETEKLPDGSTLRRRFEDGRLDSITQCHEYPSGRQTTIRFDASNKKVEETHSIGLEIILTMTFEGGSKTSETYICKRRLATRNTYEKHRTGYPDMPAADASLKDSSAELLALVREDRKKERLAAAAREIDAERGHKLDAFCERMIHGEGVEDACSWIDHSGSTLGEMSRSTSRRLIANLRQMGCPSIYACKVCSQDGKRKNSGHLVVELPNTPDQRVRVRTILSRIAQRQGYDPYPDDGQRVEYAKLD